jgi:hypothetical protein
MTERRKPAAAQIELQSAPEPDPKDKLSALVELFKHVDQVAWQNQATLLGVTVLALTGLGQVFDASFDGFPIDRKWAVIAILILSGGLYLATLRTFEQAHKIRRNIQDQIEKDADNGGCGLPFSVHDTSKWYSWMLSASWATRTVYYLVVAACVGGAVAAGILMPSR